MQRILNSYKKNKFLFIVGVLLLVLLIFTTINLINKESASPDVDFDENGEPLLHTAPDPNENAIENFNEEYITTYFKDATFDRNFFTIEIIGNSAVKITYKTDNEFMLEPLIKDMIQNGIDPDDSRIIYNPI